MATFIMVVSSAKMNCAIDTTIATLYFFTASYSAIGMSF